jgi:hypothetical protein
MADAARIWLICKPLTPVSHGRATGSIPVPPTIQKRRRNRALGNFLGLTFDNKTLAQQWAGVTPAKRGAADENLRLKAMALRPFARIGMAALTSSHLATYRDERLKVVSGATVNREFNVLSHAIDTARREWDIYLPPPCLGAGSVMGRPRPCAARVALGSSSINRAWATIRAWLTKSRTSRKLRESTVLARGKQAQHNCRARSWTAQESPGGGGAARTQCKCFARARAA